MGFVLEHSLFFTIGRADISTRSCMDGIGRFHAFLKEKTLQTSSGGKAPGHNFVERSHSMWDFGVKMVLTNPSPSRVIFDIFDSAISK